MKDDSPSPAQNLLTAGRCLVIGHRGYCARAPENTIPSFQLALEAGADLVEMDYHHSSDGVPMVIHDATLDHTTDARQKWRRLRTRVASRTAAEIEGLDAGRWFDAKFAGTRVPLLSEALDLISSSGGIPLIEHKTGDVRTCIELLRRRKWINRVVIISFDWSWLREFHELEPAQVLGALGAPTRLADGSKPPRRRKHLSAAWIKDLAPTGARLAVWNRHVSKISVQHAHEQKLKVWIYTVNEVRLANGLLDAGVDGLITNEIELIQSVVAKR